ncbi:caspase family protein, partial [Azospirillum sp. TSA6c]|uniref:caspase family protein n=1 Tax=Azospirillum sp. TSA6c TaxID=709813 RepID=UPI0018EE60DB
MVTTPKESNDLKKPVARDGALVSNAKNGHKRAVLIGINDYQGTINDLPSCLEDVSYFKNTLERCFGFDEITVLTDAQATISNVSSSIASLFKDASSIDRLVFFYSGHGSTEKRNGIMQECLVLYDGFFYDDDFVKLTRNIPSGVLSVVLDSCFSGGMEKQLLQPILKEGVVVDRAKVKAFTRTSYKDFVSHANEQEEARKIKRFGCDVLPIVNIIPTRNHVSETVGEESSSILKDLLLPPPSDEIGDPKLNGIMLSACLETETAAASTPYTKGRSAFTFALTETIDKYGIDISTNSIMSICQKKLKEMGFSQTPLVKEPETPNEIGGKSIIMFSDVSQRPIEASSDHLQQVMREVLNRILGNNKETPTMDVQTLLPLLANALRSSQNGAENKSIFGDLGPVLPMLIPPLTAA